ncbi:hypothetical protein KF840_24835 [bacterium]|nr:hypothetical protein [bacterium]
MTRRHRMLIGVLGVGLLATLTGCPKKPFPPDLQARIEAAANKAEAAANQADASASKAAASAQKAQAVADKLGSRGWNK